MNKLLAVFTLIMYSIGWLLCKPIDCFIKATVESHFLNFTFFVECYKKQWNHVDSLSLKEGVVLFKELWGS